MVIILVEVQKSTKDIVEMVHLIKSSRMSSEISLFAFRNVMRMSTKWQNLDFWMNHPIKLSYCSFTMQCQAFKFKWILTVCQCFIIHHLRIICSKQCNYFTNFSQDVTMDAKRYAVMSVWVPDWPEFSLMMFYCSLCTCVCVSEALQRPYYADYSPARLYIHTLCTSHYLDLFITIIIAINVLTMSMEHYGQPKVCRSAHTLYI